jgi:2-phosphoglycerate kinase
MNAEKEVILIGGASGTGKSSIAYELGKLLHMNIVQVDDFQCLVEAATKECDYPVFHYWKNHFEEACRQSIEKKLEIMTSYADELSVFLNIIVKNHLEEKRPMILEGDFISPCLCKKLLEDASIKGRVACIFVTEDSKDQIIKNYEMREGSIQEERAELSFHYNNWLKEQSQGTDIKLISSRPWETAVQRIMETL